MTVTDGPRWSPPRLCPDGASASLTARQAQILSGVCRGLTNEQIGRELYLTENSVKTHLKRLSAASVPATGLTRRRSQPN